MGLVSGIEALFSLRASGRFDPPCEIGLIMPGFYMFGSEPIYMQRPGGEPFLVSGIFQRRHSAGKIVLALVGHMIPKNPRTETQQANRDKYADGVAEWQGLTNEQKEVYNTASRGKKFSGYNLFLSEYLRSH